MWSYVEVNDTLQITNEQGFPEILKYDQHLNNSFSTKDFEWKIFEFRNKKDIRLYHMPPVRNFLVENINWKWLYWWQIHMLEVNHDYVNKITSGKYKIIHINTPEEMSFCHRILD